VKVYDGSTTTAPLLGTFSGTSLPPVLKSSGGSMLITFTTDRGVVADGWSATYTSSTTSKSESESVTVKLPEQEISPAVTEIIAYPNPTSGILTVQFPVIEETTYAINLINFSGQIIQDEIINVLGGKFEIDLSDFIDGYYLLKIQTDKFSKYIRVIKSSR